MLRIDIVTEDHQKVTSITDKDANYNFELNVFEVSDESGYICFVDPFAYLDDLKGRFVG